MAENLFKSLNKKLNNNSSLRKVNSEAEIIPEKAYWIRGTYFKPPKDQVTCTT